MLKTVLVCLAASAALCLGPARLHSQPAGSAPAASNPLAPFDRLVGGEWHLGDSYQVFEWGAGRRSVRARSYFIVDGEPRLVSEGLWFWHPAQKTIRGSFTAIGMPADLFEYSARFEDNALVGELQAYSSDGAVSRYLEKWQFTDAASFEWTLFSRDGDELHEQMKGVYSRTR